MAGYDRDDWQRRDKQIEDLKERLAGVEYQINMMAISLIIIVIIFVIKAI